MEPDSPGVPGIEEHPYGRRKKMRRTQPMLFEKITWNLMGDMK